MSNVIQMMVSKAERLHTAPAGVIRLDRDQAHADVALELADDMTKALAGHRDWVTVGCMRDMTQSAERLQDSPGAIVEMLDYAGPAEALLKVLAQSQCHLVDALRAAIIKQHVDTNVDWVFEARGSGLVPVRG